MLLAIRHKNRNWKRWRSDAQKRRERARRGAVAAFAKRVEARMAGTMDEQ